MKKADILQALKNNQMQVFEVEEQLDVGCDIILSNSSIDEFIRFSNSVNQKIAFYEMSFIKQDYFLVDEDKFCQEIESIILKKLESCYFGDEYLTIDDFQDEIKQKVREIRKHNADVQKRIRTLDETEVLYASVYTIYNGAQVGILIENDCMDDYQTVSEIEDTLEDSILELIAPKLAQYEMDEDAYYEKMERDMEERQNKEKEKRQKVMMEIRGFIENDNSLLECTNGKKRHAYAKRMVDDYSSKFNVAITIGDVEVIVDEVYKKLRESTK